MTAPFELRDATRAHVAAIAAIYAHHVTTGFGTFDEEPPTMGEMAERLVRVT